MSIPMWVISSFAVIGLIFVLSFIAAFIGVSLARFMKEEE